MTTDVIELMEKANRSLKSARLVFADGDPDGACNRAYYAMFSGLWSTANYWHNRITQE